MERVSRGECLIPRLLDPDLCVNEGGYALVVPEQLVAHDTTGSKSQDLLDKPALIYPRIPSLSPEYNREFVHIAVIPAFHCRVYRTKPRARQRESWRKY